VLLDTFGAGNVVPTSVAISATDGQLVDRVLAEVVDVEDPLAEVDGVEEPLAEVVGVPAEVVGADDPDFEQPATRSTHAIDETTMAARRQICESKLIESSQCQGRWWRGCRALTGTVPPRPANTTGRPATDPAVAPPDSPAVA
jgi:hypothetical protein